MEHLEKPKKVIYFFEIEGSINDEKEKCIRVPIKDKDYYFDVGNMDFTHDNIKKKYPELKFTGKQEIVDKDDGTKELAFFYK